MGNTSLFNHINLGKIYFRTYKLQAIFEVFEAHGIWKSVNCKINPLKSVGLKLQTKFKIYEIKSDLQFNDSFESVV